MEFVEDFLAGLFDSKQVRFTSTPRDVMQSTQELHNHKKTNPRLYPDLSCFYNNGESNEHGGGSFREYDYETIRPDYPLYPDIQALNLSNSIRETELTSNEHLTSCHNRYSDIPTLKLSHDICRATELTSGENYISGYNKYPDIPPLNISHDFRETKFNSGQNYPSGYNGDILNMDDICEPDYDVDDCMDNNINVHVPDRKVLNNKLIEVKAANRKPFSDRYGPDYQKWMTWRKQVNTHLAAMILIKQGKKVYITPSDQTRKCLSRSIMETVFDEAQDEHRIAKTSLPGKPYIMYGIPRVKLR